MRYSWLILVVGILLAGVRVEASEGQARSNEQRLLELVAASDGFSGTILVSNDQGADYSIESGFADIDKRRAVAAEDIWRWASVTKQLVAVLAMQEVEAGRLGLDQPLAELLPDYTIATADRITLRQLLQHTSGLANPESLSAGEFTNGFDPARFCRNPPVSEPGARFAYNNCDYYVIGRILERVAGKRWDTLLDERILRPAGMTKTTVGASDRLRQTVTGYANADRPSPDPDLALYGAAGAIYGSPQDLVRFNRALMDGTLLGREAREVLWTGDPALGFVALGAWSFEARLDGCDDPVKLIERRGFIANIAVRNFIAPELGQSAVVFVNRGDFEFGEVWMQSGFSFDLLGAAFCQSKP